MQARRSQYRGLLPVDRRTNVEILRLQQLHQDLQPLVLPEPQENKLKLLELPVEIVQQIASYLPPSAKAAFALTSLAAASVIGTQSWKDLGKRENVYERHDFGRLLERDTDNGVYCYGCGKMHYVSLHSTSSMKRYYSIPQLRQQMRRVPPGKGHETLLYLYTLMYRSGMTCGHVCKLATWEYWSSRPQQLWEYTEHSLLQDSWGWVVMPPTGHLPEDGIRVFPIASDSEAPDTTHVFQIQIGQTRHTSVPILPPSRLIQLGPSMYAHQHTSLADSQLSWSACSIIISGPPPKEHVVTKRSPIKIFVRKLFGRRQYLRVDANERSIRSLRNSKKIADRTMDLRIFRDEMWDRDRQVWAIEQQRKTLKQYGRFELSSRRVTPMG